MRELAPIYVTAPTRDTQPLDTTATTTTVLSHDDLENNKYALVPDALQSVPGLSVVTSGMPGAETSVFIHGLEARQTLVTVDGRRQSSGFSGADDNLANLTLDNVDQIEVVKTPVTTAQGGSAMGGVINLVTLSGKGVAPTGDAWFEGRLVRHLPRRRRVARPDRQLRLRRRRLAAGFDLSLGQLRLRAVLHHRRSQPGRPVPQLQLPRQHGLPGQRRYLRRLPRRLQQRLHQLAQPVDDARSHRQPGHRGLEPLARGRVEG